MFNIIYRTALVYAVIQQLIAIVFQFFLLITALVIGTIAMLTVNKQEQLKFYGARNTADMVGALMFENVILVLIFIGLIIATCIGLSRFAGAAGGAAAGFKKIIGGVTGGAMPDEVRERVTTSISSLKNLDAQSIRAFGNVASKRFGKAGRGVGRAAHAVADARDAAELATVISSTTSTNKAGKVSTATKTSEKNTKTSTRAKEQDVLSQDERKNARNAEMAGVLGKNDDSLKKPVTNAARSTVKKLDEVANNKTLLAATTAAGVKGIDEFKRQLEQGDKTKTPLTSRTAKDKGAAKTATADAAKKLATDTGSPKLSPKAAKKAAEKTKDAAELAAKTTPGLPSGSVAAGDSAKTRKATLETQAKNANSAPATAGEGLRRAAEVMATGGAIGGSVAGAKLLASKGDLAAGDTRKNVMDAQNAHLGGLSDPRVAQRSAERNTARHMAVATGDFRKFMEAQGKNPNDATYADVKEWVAKDPVAAAATAAGAFVIDKDKSFGDSEKSKIRAAVEEKGVAYGGIAPEAEGVAESAERIRSGILAPVSTDDIVAGAKDLAQDFNESTVARATGEDVPANQYPRVENGRVVYGNDADTRTTDVMEAVPVAREAAAQDAAYSDPERLINPYGAHNVDGADDSTRAGFAAHAGAFASGAALGALMSSLAGGSGNLLNLAHDAKTMMFTSNTGAQQAVTLSDQTLRRLAQLVSSHAMLRNESALTSVRDSILSDMGGEFADMKASFSDAIDSALKEAGRSQLVEDNEDERDQILNGASYVRDNAEQAVPIQKPATHLPIDVDSLELFNEEEK